MLSATPAEFVAESVAASETSVFLFSKSTCPFCKKAKKLFGEEEIPFTAVEINEREDMEDIQAALEELTGAKTVPSIFIKGEYFGGFDKTKKANKKGQLKPMLE